MNEPPASSSSSSNLPATDDRPQLIRSHDSRDDSIKDNRGTIATGGNAELHDRTGLYLAIIALVFSAMAFGMAIVLPMVYEARMQNLSDRVVIAERESRVTQERYNDIKVELVRRGIPVSDH